MHSIHMHIHLHMQQDLNQVGSSGSRFSRFTMSHVNYKLSESDPDSALTVQLEYFDL